MMPIAEYITQTAVLLNWLIQTIIFKCENSNQKYTTVQTVTTVNYNSIFTS